MEAALAGLPDGSVNPEKLARAGEALSALRDQLTDLRAAEIVLCPKARVSMPRLMVSCSERFCHAAQDETRSAPWKSPMCRVQPQTTHTAQSMILDAVQHPMTAECSV